VLESGAPALKRNGNFGCEQLSFETIEAGNDVVENVFERGARRIVRREVLIGQRKCGVMRTRREEQRVESGRGKRGGQEYGWRPA
jgi:hypothetical protein